MIKVNFVYLYLPPESNLPSFLHPQEYETNLSMKEMVSKGQRETVAATGEQAVVQCKLDRICENINLAKIAEEMVSWEKYAPYCGLSLAEEMEIKENCRQYGVQKRRMLQRWKARSGKDATYRNLAEIFERVEDQTLANFVLKLAQDQRKIELNNRSIRRWDLVKYLIPALIALIAVIAAICYTHQPAKYSLSKDYTQYVDKVKQRYKKHLPDVAQSFWLPANMHTFIQLSLTRQDKPRVPKVDQYSANERMVSEPSMTFDDLLSEIDASPGSRILVRGQPGIGKTTLLQMITRSWAHDKALSSCWILLHIVLRDLVLLQHAPNLTTFLSFVGSTMLPPDIETHVLESDGKGLCFIADGLDEYPAGYEDKTNFIFQLIGEQRTNIKLPQSTIVISSRPEVASRVWDMFDKRVEVLGFGDDQIDEYIQAKYSKDKSFSKYLDDHPHIKHTCYSPLHLAMMVYLKDSLLDNLPETETEIYEQFIIHTIIRDFCKDPTSSCSRKNTFPTFLNNINESSSLLFHIAKLAYSGIQKRQSIFTEVESVLQRTNTSLLVVDKMNVLQPATYSFPHLTIQEFLAAFYFNTYLNQTEQKRVLVEYSKQRIRYRDDDVYWVFWRFCCGLKRNENQTPFLEFFNLLYQYNNESELPYHCAHEAQSVIASQQLINFTKGIAKLSLETYYDTASFIFVAVSAAQNLHEISSYFVRFPKVLLHKLCDATTVYSQLRRIDLHIPPSNVGCLLQKSPNLESLRVFGSLDWYRLQSEDAAALVLPPYGTTLLNIRHIHLKGLKIGDKGVKKLSQLLQDSIILETLSLQANYITDNGASAIVDLMKALPHLQHVYLDFNHIGDKGVETLSQLLQDSRFLETLSLCTNGITDNGASAIADLVKALPHLQHVVLYGNHIGGRGAALLWNQSIHKCCNLNLDENIIGDDTPDAFISTLSDTVNNGYERNKSCQLEVRMFGNKFLCSDLRDILTISKKLPKGVTLKIGSHCLNMTEKILNRIGFHLGKKYHPVKAEFRRKFYAVFTLHIFCSTRTKLWGLLYFVLSLFMSLLSSFDYFVRVDYFIFIVSLLWTWIVVGRLFFCVALKLLPKGPQGWALFTIIPAVVELYFIYPTAPDCFSIYIFFILGYVLFRLILFPLKYLSICCSKFYGRLWSYVGYEFFMEVLKIGLHC